MTMTTGWNGRGRLNTKSTPCPSPGISRETTTGLPVHPRTAGQSLEFLHTLGSGEGTPKAPWTTVAQTNHLQETEGGPLSLTSAS